MNLELLEEANKRGLLDDERKGLLEEAKRRGIGATTASSPPKNNLLDNAKTAMRGVISPIQDMMEGSQVYGDRINQEARKRLDEMDPPKPARAPGEGKMGWIRDKLAAMNETIDSPFRKAQDTVASFGTKFANQFTFDQSPKILSAFETPFTDKTYQENVDIREAMDKIRQGDSPLAASAGSFAGDIGQYLVGTKLLSMLPGLGASKQILEAQKAGAEAVKALPTSVKLANVGKNILKGGMTSAALGQGQGSDLEQAPTDFLLGVSGEALVPALSLAG